MPRDVQEKVYEQHHHKLACLGGGGIAGIGWEVGLLAGLRDGGIDVRNADLMVGTSAGSNVASLISSDLTMEAVFQRQVNPALQAKELSVSPDFQKMIADLHNCFEQGGTGTEILQRVGALALATSTPAEVERRSVIASRLPMDTWPQPRLEIVGVSTTSGERVVFDRESGVDLIDAVTASSAVPCVWPPVTIGTERYIDGGCYSMANADLALGFEKVLILQPDVPPFPLVKTLDEELELLLQNGAKVEVIRFGDEMKEALAVSGGNALDPSIRGVAAQAGRAQGLREAPRIAAFWG